MLLIMTGLDHHLSALNIFGIMHLIVAFTLNTPYFKWEMENSLSKKLEGLLIKLRGEEI